MNVTWCISHPLLITSSCLSPLLILLIFSPTFYQRAHSQTHWAHSNHKALAPAARGFLLPGLLPMPVAPLSPHTKPEMPVWLTAGALEPDRMALSLAVWLWVAYRTLLLLCVCFCKKTELSTEIVVRTEFITYWASKGSASAWHKHVFGEGYLQCLPILWGHVQILSPLSFSRPLINATAFPYPRHLSFKK